MKFKYAFMAAIGAASLFLAQCTTDKKVAIGEENVSRIIKTLSADEMRGRNAFSPDIEMAADFIAGEYRQIGLQPLNGDNYRQEFEIFSVQTEESSVRINNADVDPQNYFARSFSDEFEWDLQNAHIAYITKDDDFRAKLREFLSDSVSSLIIVDETHHEWFNRYRRFMNRPVRSLDISNEHDDVFVLTSQPPLHSLSVKVTNTITPVNLFNVGGKIEGKRKDEIVLFSAHYDHIGVIAPVNGDSIANGANDNATGVAATIELARHFSKQRKPERTIYFVNFTAEESGGFGSRYFSQLVDPESIVAMFNIEMIGKPAVDGPNTAWITGFDYSTFGEILKNSNKDSSFVFYPDPYPNQNLFFRSDNATLARLGVPAHTISTTPIDVDDDYHRVTDEFHTINIQHTTNTIAAIAKAAMAIISGDKTPTRINPEILQ